MRRFLIAAVIVIAIVAVVRGCVRETPPKSAVDTASSSATGRHSVANATASATAAAQARADARSKSLLDAVNVLHRYFEKIGAGDFKAADALWGYNRSPQRDAEGGLRALMPARALRSQNEEPEVLDREPLPESIKVPVNLRFDAKDGHSYRYAGWYRMRRNTVEGRWELIEASLQPQLR